MSKVVTIVRATISSGKVKIRMEGVPVHVSQSMVDLINMVATNVNVQSRAKECWKICEDCDCMPKQKMHQ